MRLKGQIRQVTDSITGKTEWSQYPQTREQAFIEDVAKYWPMTPCPLHGDRSVYYTITGEAACCAHHAAAAAYNDAVCVHGEPASLDAALQRGLDYYWHPEVNPHCGHPGKRNFAGKCYLCSEHKANSPRKLALRSGEIWYMPAADDPCPRGHVGARRRVNNGSCEECEKVAAAARQAKSAQEVQPINKLVPDLVIDRQAARTFGYTVYRTGKPCSNGHTGWRYVSTGACLDCMGRG